MTGSVVLQRGRVIGLLVALLGVWGAIVPFIGPYFGYAYTPDTAWAYTTGRLWLSVVPGAVTFVGGLAILASARAANVGSILAALAGAWFVLGQSIVALMSASQSVSAGYPVVSAGLPVSPATMRFLEGLGFFYGLGVVIVFLAALALGRARTVTSAAPYAHESVEPDYRPVY